MHWKRRIDPTEPASFSDDPENYMKLEETHHANEGFYPVRLAETPGANCTPTIKNTPLTGDEVKEIMNEWRGYVQHVVNVVEEGAALSTRGGKGSRGR